MSAGKIPGLAFAVVQGQEVVIAQGLGVTSVEDKGCLVKPHTVFRIGSITKPLTGTAVLRLVEAGRLALDTPVAEYLPCLNLSEPGAAQQVTVRMLLTHSAGLPTDIVLRGTRDPQGLASFLQAELPRYPLVAPPGLVSSYSNLGFCLLGHLAEVVTGQTYQELMSTLVFAPLRMNRTTFDPTLAMSHPLSQSHQLTADGDLHVLRPFADNSAFTPAGFAYSTVLDLANFARMHLAGGRFEDGQLLGSELITEMHKLQVPTYSAGGGGSGLSLFVDPHPRSGLLRVGHMGGITGFRALFEVYPTLEAAVIVVINRAGEIGKIRDVIMEECLGVATAGWQPSIMEADRSRWPDYTGTYLSDTQGLAEVRVEADQLLVVWNGERFGLDCCRPGHYVSRLRNGSYFGAGFVPDSTGQIRYLMVSETPFRRVPPVEAAIHPETWDRFEGTYALKQPPMTIRTECGMLFLHSAFFGKEVQCIPLGNTEFACQWGRFSFQVSEDGQVVGMSWLGAGFIPRVERRKA